MSKLAIAFALGFAATAQFAPAQAPPAKAPLETPTSVLTETVGLLAGVQLYQTYLNIGLLADARAEGTYETADVELLLQSVYKPLVIVEKQLEKVGKLKGMTKEDTEALGQLTKIAGLLRQQGEELTAFWNSGEEAKGKKYEATRQKSWTEIEALLDLKPKAEAAAGAKPAAVPAPKVLK
jgi:hypothetical protein